MLVSLKRAHFSHKWKSVWLGGYSVAACFSVSDMQPRSQDWDYPGRVGTIREQSDVFCQMSSLRTDTTWEEQKRIPWNILVLHKCVVVFKQLSDGIYQLSSSWTSPSTSSSSTESKIDSSSCGSSPSQGCLYLSNAPPTTQRGEAEL